MFTIAPPPITVTTLDDELDSADPNATLADFGGAGDLSLREALVLARRTTGADTITFAQGGVIKLNPLLEGRGGALFLDTDVTIDGRISTGDLPFLVLDAGDETRHFYVAGEASVSLVGLGLAKGLARGSDGGDGGISNMGSAAGGGGGLGAGGSIYVAAGGALGIETVFFFGNAAQGGDGGTFYGGATASSGDGGSGTGEPEFGIGGAAGANNPFYGQNGENGGYGGGGGGGGLGNWGDGRGGAGGFGGGGGGGGNDYTPGGAGGFGAGNGGGFLGGGGAGLGGAIFLGDGATLTVAGNTGFVQNKATGGAAPVELGLSAGNGQGLGGAIFSYGANLTFTPGEGEEINFESAIVGVAGTDTPGSVTLDGAGTLVLRGANAFTGETVVASGTLSIDGTLATGDLRIESGLSLKADSVPSTPIVAVTGEVTLRGASLQLDFVDGIATKTGDIFVLIAGAGSASIDGEFLGYEDGDRITAGGRPFVISYRGGDGNDVVLRALDPTFRGTSQGDLLTGTAGRDVMLGQGGDDMLIGNAGDDSLSGMAGADTMQGGAGSDVYYVENVDDVVVDEASDAGVDTIYTKVDYDLTFAIGVERLIANTDVGLALYGNELNNTIVGGGGSDYLFGNEGDDVLDGRAGTDRMIGGAGADTYHVDSFFDEIVGEQPGAEIDTVITTGDYSLYSIANVERLVARGSLNLRLRGSEIANEIIGGGGADELFGHGGDDILNGGAGADLMNGDAGSDTYFVDNVGDIIAGEADGIGIDTVNTTVSYSIEPYKDVERLVAISNAGLTLTGNSGDNGLIGGAGNDTLIGGAGADKLTGGRGADQLEGGSGSDIYYVDNAGDTIVGEAVGGGVDIVYASTSYSIAGADNVERLVAGTRAGVTLTGNGLANLITGGAGDDTLFGGAGGDTLKGGTGADQLNGGLGRDILTGGGDSDVFVFASVSDSVRGVYRDSITDFVAFDFDDFGQAFDRIDLSGIDAIAGGFDDSFSFIDGAAFSKTAGELRVFTVNGVTVVAGDVNGDGVADFEIGLQGAPTVSIDDFLL